MTRPQPYLDAERRQLHVSHAELRRQLIAADEERYRLRCELREFSGRGWRASPTSWSGWLPTRRLTIGVGAAIVSAAAAGLFWEMCPSSFRADARPPRRVETKAVAQQTLAPDVATQVVTRVAGHGQLRPAVAERLTPAVAATPPVATRVSGPVSKPRAGRPRQAALVRASPRATLRVEPPTRRLAAPRPLSPGEFGRKAL